MISQKSDELKCLNKRCTYWDSTMECNCAKGEQEPVFDTCNAKLTWDEMPKGKR